MPSDKEFWKAVDEKIDSALLVINDVFDECDFGGHKMSIVNMKLDYPPRVKITVMFAPPEKTNRSLNHYGALLEPNDKELGEIGRIMTEIAERLRVHPVRVSKANVKSNGLVEYMINADYDKIKV